MDHVETVFPKVNIPTVNDSIEPIALFTAVAGTLESEIECEIDGYGIAASKFDRALSLEFVPDNEDATVLTKLRINFTTAQTSWDLPLPISWDPSKKIWEHIAIELEEGEEEIPESERPEIKDVLEDVAGRCVYFIESALDEKYDNKNAERDVLFNILNFYKTIPEGVDLATAFAKIFLIALEAGHKVGMTQEDITNGMQLVVQYQSALENLDANDAQN